MGKTIHPTEQEKNVRVIHGDEILNYYGKGQLIDTVWNKLYLPECFSGIRFPDGHNYEDVSTTWKIMTRLANANGTVVCLPESLFHFRMRKSSISHTKSCRNIIDSWVASREKYEGIPVNRNQFLSGCFRPIGRMWMSYYGFTDNEKAMASDIVLEMRSFSRKHFHQIMRGKATKRTKAFCLISQTSSPLLMWFCYWGGKLLYKIKYLKRKMYP